jgi:predicted nucleotidyltransferase
MKFGLNHKVISSIHKVLARFSEVDKVIIYGSRAKGNYKTGSDIDLTLCGNAQLNLQTMFQIIEDLDELMLPYSFDISIFDQISDSEVIEHINRVGKIFYQKPG